VPLAATLCRGDLWDAAYGSTDRALLHSSTFGGGTFSATAGLATLDVPAAERLPEYALETGVHPRAGPRRACELLPDGLRPALGRARRPSSPPSAICCACVRGGARPRPPHPDVRHRTPPARAAHPAPAFKENPGFGGSSSGASPSRSAGRATRRSWVASLLM
jgi:hypothetical protein